MTTKVDPCGLAHHWLIESPNGPTCEARCKKCKRVRTYPTTTPESGTASWSKEAADRRRQKGRYASTGSGVKGSEG